MAQLQLQQLMETLNATEPHYIRCVKPNNLLKPAIFENSNIMQQLRCGVSTLRLVAFFSFRSLHPQLSLPYNANSLAFML